MSAPASADVPHRSAGPPKPLQLIYSSIWGGGQGSLTWRASPFQPRRYGQPVYVTCFWKSNPLEIFDPDTMGQSRGLPAPQPPPEETTNHGGTLAVLVLAATSAQLPEQ